MARAAAEVRAVGNRDAPLYLFTAGIAPTPDVAAGLKDAVQRYRTAVQLHVRGGMWMNFIERERCRRKSTHRRGLRHRRASTLARPESEVRPEQHLSIQLSVGSLS
jgi:hypothetical protein